MTGIFVRHEGFKLFGRSKTKPSFIRIDALDHPILGRLEPHDKVSAVLSGSATVDGTRIEIWVAPDGGPLDAALKLAADAVSILQDLDARCRLLVAADSLASYNSDWRFGAELHDDGTTKNFEKPRLTAEQFVSTLSPTTLEITGSSLLTFWYSDGDMFWGHSLCLTSFDGLALTDTTVQMQG